MLQDSIGRSVTYLRLALTHEPAVQGMYARPDALAATSGRQLSAGQIERLVAHLAANHGVQKVRLSGDDPTDRPDLVEIVQRLSRIEGVKDLAMTTHGRTLARQAKELAAAGLQRVNVGLDSLDAEKYQRITGVDALPRVIEGIDAAVAAGLNPIKLNTVVIRWENDYELADLLLFAAWKGLEIRFIEYLPMGVAAPRWEKRFVPESEMRQRLEGMGICWSSRPDTRDPARRYTAGMSFGRSVRVGFITAISCPFCSACNRLRIAADGTMYPCLMGRPGASLAEALDPFDPAAVDRLLADALAHKSADHGACRPVGAGAQA